MKDEQIRKCWNAIVEQDENSTAALPHHAWRFAKALLESSKPSAQSPDSCHHLARDSWNDGAVTCRDCYSVLTSFVPAQAEASTKYLPAKYEVRQKPEWDGHHPWSPWKECSAETAANYRELGLKSSNWVFEVRELFGHPATPAQAGAPVALTAKQIKKLANDHFWSRGSTSPLDIEKAIRAALVETRVTPTAEQPAQTDFTGAVRKLAFCCRTDTKRHDDELLAALDAVENALAAQSQKVIG